MKAKQCSYEGCNNPSWSRGRCKYHPLDKKAKMAANKPLKRSPLKKESSKRQKKSSIYSVLKRKYLEDNSLCEICCSSYSGEIHHKFAGADRDKYMNDTSTWMALCNFCHKEVHENPRWAREMGYLK